MFRVTSHAAVRAPQRFRARSGPWAVVTGASSGLGAAMAGFGTSGPFLATDVARELAMLNVNCAAVLAMSLHFGRRFTQRGRGGIVLMASLVGRQGTPHAGGGRPGSPHGPLP